MSYFKAFSLIILAVLLSLNVWTQEKNVLKGIIISQKEEKAIQYANIRIKDSPYGTTSDENGKFEFSFPNQFSKDTLIISCIGYKRLVLPLSTLNLKQLQHFELEDSLILLNEVVAMAYDFIDALKWKTKKDDKSRLYLTFATREIQNAANFISILKETFGKDFKLKSNFIRWKKVKIPEVGDKITFVVAWFRCPYCPDPENITVTIDVMDKKDNSLVENPTYTKKLEKYFQNLLDKTFAQGVDYRQLESRDSITYLKKSTEPYTGQCYGYYENGQKGLRGAYVNGVRDGVWEYWYSNGQKKVEGKYKKGLKDGQWLYWYPSGQLRIKAFYKDNEMDGTNIWYHENGQKKKEAVFRNGVYIEKTEWDEKGNVIEIRNFLK
ncbi:MAG: carboxypeptidase-like regulatory domain-containing protein [Bacteroidales bacterium]|nr:carboxypeptidase-like regulatory domain-containing protein [Bacteroidales bacterium]